MPERTCTKCGQIKPLTEFNRAAHGLGGYAAHCKDCHREYRKAPGRAPVLTCQQCGAEFPNPARRGPDRKFCSLACKNEWWRQEYGRRRKVTPPRPCQKCGGPVAHKTGIPVCKDCRVDDRTRPYKRAMHIKSRYGVTQEEYDRLLALQRNQCAICKAKTPGSRGEWRIDHDHVTGQVRGLLCDGCNRGIGCLQDDPEIIAAAARYVARHRQMQLFGAAVRQ